MILSFKPPLAPSPWAAASPGLPLCCPISRTARTTRTSQTDAISQERSGRNEFSDKKKEFKLEASYVLQELTEDEASWVGSTYTLGAMFSGLVTGYLLDRNGAKKKLLTWTEDDDIFSSTTIFAINIFT